MKQLFLFIFLLATSSAKAQPTFVPDDLSYDLRIHQRDIGLVGKVSSMGQFVKWTNSDFEPSEACYEYDTDVYEEQHYINGYAYPLKGHTPCIDLLKEQMFSLHFSDEGYATFFYWGTPKVESNSQFFKYGPRDSDEATYNWSDNHTIKSIDCKSFGFDKKFQLSYDNQGRLVEKGVLMDRKSSEFVYPTTYEYDSQGRVIKATTTPTHKGKPSKHIQTRNYNYSYEGTNLVVTSVCACLNEDHNKERRTRWVYDSNNHLIEQRIDIYGIKNNKVYYSKIVINEYDEDGQLVKTNKNSLNIGGYYGATTPDIAENLLINNGKKIVTTFAYNDHGDLEEVQTSSTGIINITNYEYNYDSQGNWVRRTMTIDDVLASVVTREIHYQE